MNEFKGFRIVYSPQRQKYKIQVKVFFFWWIDVTNGNDHALEFETREGAVDALRRYDAVDWDVI